MRPDSGFESALPCLGGYKTTAFRKVFPPIASTDPSITPVMENGTGSSGPPPGPPGAERPRTLAAAHRVAPDHQTFAPRRRGPWRPEIFVSTAAGLHVDAWPHFRERPRIASECEATKGVSKQPNCAEPSTIARHCQTHLARPANSNFHEWRPPPGSAQFAVATAPRRVDRIPRWKNRKSRQWPLNLYTLGLR
jgi:hypothetical protein